MIFDNLYQPVKLTKGKYFVPPCVETALDWQRHGVAESLIHGEIERAKESGLVGVTLDCKNHLISYYSK